MLQHAQAQTIVQDSVEDAGAVAGAHFVACQVCRRSHNYNIPVRQRHTLYCAPSGIASACVRPSSKPAEHPLLLLADWFLPLAN